MELTAKEYDLIELLMRNPRRVYSRENLMNGLCGPGRLQEGVMLLGRAARERLEPVRKVRRALLERPVLHPLGDRIRNRRVKGLALPHCREQLRRDRLRKMRADRLLGEDVFAIGL